MRPILVGERNPHSTDPRRALYPEPGTSGDRLCRTILGMTPRMYLAAFVRVNLVGGGCEWTDEEARSAARRLLSSTPPDQKIILLGDRVWRAFKHLEDGLAGTWEPFAGRGRRFLLLPHPSGRCRVWNDPAAIDAAMLAVLKFHPDVYKVPR